MRKKIIRALFLAVLLFLCIYTFTDSNRALNFIESKKLYTETINVVTDSGISVEYDDEGLKEALQASKFYSARKEIIFSIKAFNRFLK